MMGFGEIWRLWPPLHRCWSSANAGKGGQVAGVSAICWSLVLGQQTWSLVLVICAVHLDVQKFTHLWWSLAPDR